MQKNILLLGLACTLIMSGCNTKKGSKTKTYDYTSISRGTVERTVSSSGSLNPVSTVNVLPRMSGKVEKVYVDYNDVIHKGDILAELNTDMLKLQREQQLAQVIKNRANYDLQLVNFQNQQRLAEKNLISEYELKTGRTTLAVQSAELSAAEASLQIIETEINQYAFITSPINGIVLARNINEGETVADSSSNNASKIFTLAENLEEMQIETGVGELDIASIYKGQDIRFTVEALPGRTFSGTVESKRLMPTTQDNVVSYTVIINVSNQDGLLLPGMTCAVEFIVERSENVLMVPNAALRYQPTGLSADTISDMVFNAGLQGMNEEQRKAAIAARAQTKASASSSQNTASSAGTGLTGLVMGSQPAVGGRGGAPGGAPGSGGPGNAPAAQGSGAGRSGTRPASAQAPTRTLWYLNSEGKLDVIMVRSGITNGSYTEIRSTENLEGKQVILREKV